MRWTLVHKEVSWKDGGGSMENVLKEGGSVLVGKREVLPICFFAGTGR